MMTPTIALLPAARVEGWASMDRYWREIEAQAVASPLEGAEISCPLGLAPETSVTDRSWRRPFTKYITYPWLVSRLRVDLVHLLDHSYAHLLRRLPRGVRSIVTAFDLAPLQDSRCLTPAQVRRFEKTVRNLARADLVLAMSHQTEGQLIQRAGVDPKRIRVVYPGTNVPAFAKPIADFPSRERLPSGAKILLSVGHAEPRKNIPFLLEAFTPLAARFQQGRCCFVRAGQKFEPALAERFRVLLGRGFVELGPCYGDDLVGVFQRAHVFILPSTLEGFSFTMMEAMAAGVPVLANRTTTNPEVGQEAVLYHENGDAAGAARQLERLLDDTNVWAEYRARGYARVAELTWEAHWSAVKDNYQRVLAQPPRNCS